MVQNNHVTLAGQCDSRGNKYRGHSAFKNLQGKRTWSTYKSTNKDWSALDEYQRPSAKVCAIMPPTDITTDRFGSTISPLSIPREIKEAGLIKELEDNNYQLEALKAQLDDKKTECEALRDMLKSQSVIMKTLQNRINNQKAEIKGSLAYIASLQEQYEEATGDHEPEDDVLGRLARKDEQRRLAKMNKQEGISFKDSKIHLWDSDDSDSNDGDSVDEAVNIAQMNRPENLFEDSSVDSNISGNEIGTQPGANRASFLCARGGGHVKNGNFFAIFSELGHHTWYFHHCDMASWLPDYVHYLWE